MPEPKVQEQREYVGANTRVVQVVLEDGFLVKPEHLRRLHSVLAECPLFESGAEDDERSPVRYHASLGDGTVVELRNLDEVLAHPNTSPKVIEGLRIGRIGPEGGKIEIEFARSGLVTVDTCGTPYLVDGVLHSAQQHIRSSDVQFSWFIRLFVIDRRFRRLAAFLASWIGVAISLLVFVFLYASNSGVDVNEELIPTGMTYYQEVETAIRSNDLYRKLDVLLLGQFRSFRNATDVVQSSRTGIIACLVSFLILGVSSWILRHLTQFYPISFFAIGHQTEILERLVKSREFWMGGIIIAFAINVLAGVLVAIFGS